MAKKAYILSLLFCFFLQISYASQFDPGEELYKKDSLLSIPFISTPPTIDGVISLSEWDSSAAITGFYRYSNGQLMDDSPVAFICYDKTNIYILFITPKPTERNLIAKCSTRDGSTYQDDAVEVFLYTGDNLYQIITNTLGTITDLKNNDPAWNGQFTIAAGTEFTNQLFKKWGLNNLYWFTEMAIPFAQLDSTSEITKDWTINLAIDRASPWASLSPLKGEGNFADIRLFSKLVFLDKYAPYAQITSLGDIKFGDFDIRGTLFNPSSNSVDMHLEFDARKKGSTVTDDAYRNIMGVIHTESTTFSIAPNTNMPINIKKSYPETEINQFAIGLSFSETKTKKMQDLITRQGPLTVEPPLILKIGNVPSKESVMLSIDTTGLKNKIHEEYTIKTTISQKGTVVLPEKTIKTLPGISELHVDYSTLSQGSYDCNVVITTNDGTTLNSAQGTFNKISPPEWLTSTIYDEYGKVDRVPLPWKPVKLTDDGNSIEVWGRKISWNQKSILPSNIKTQDIELLQQPMKLVITVANKKYIVPCQTTSVAEVSEKRISRKSQGSVAGLTVSLDMWIEYDGFLWVDITTSGKDVVGTAQVEVYMPANQTTLYQTFNRPQTGCIGNKLVELPWISNESIINFYHWLGNEDFGLGFTYTSLESWIPASENNYATIYPSKDTVKYTINLIEKPTSLGNRNFRFGIQATPIKPLPSDYHSIMADTLNYEPWKAWQSIPENIDMLLVWPLETGIMKGLNDPYNVNKIAMQDNLAKAHEKHVGLLTVAACPQKISPLSKEFYDWLLEWQTIPASILNWDGIPHYQDCGASYTFRKWLFYGWAIKNVKELGTEGIYFDGWQAGQMGCANPNHGCGWTDSDGKRHLTVPVLAGREFNQRMILFLEDNVKSPYVHAKTASAREGFPQYHYWIHSWEFVPSVMGFATEWLSGEFAGWPLQGTSMLKPEGTIGGCVGLDLLRTRCLSTNYGVPNMFLPLMWENTENHATDKQTLNMYAWLLPHGIPLGGLGYMNQKTVVDISKIFINFNTRSAMFTPGWRPNPYWNIETPKIREVMIATWAYPDKNKVLAVVSNLMIKETQDIVLKWTGVEDVIVKNARTRELIECRNKTVHLTLEPESFVLLSVE